MSTFLKLNLNDLGKGCLIAIMTSTLIAIIPILQSGSFPNLATLKVIFISGLGAGLSYLIKNLFTNSNNQLLQSETKVNNVTSPPVG